MYARDRHCRAFLASQARTPRKYEQDSRDMWTQKPSELLRESSLDLRPGVQIFDFFHHHVVLSLRQIISHFSGLGSCRHLLVCSVWSQLKPAESMNYNNPNLLGHDIMKLRYFFLHFPQGECFLTTCALYRTEQTLLYKEGFTPPGGGLSLVGVATNDNRSS